jgi:hypothetical protein
MNTLPIQMQTLHRGKWPDDDDDIGRELTALVRNAVTKGRAPGSVVVFRAGRLDIIPMGPLIQNRVHMGAFIGGMTRSRLEEAGSVDIVGVMGRFRWRPNGKDEGVAVAMVFLEWPDGRWWHWRAVIDPAAGGLREHSELLHRAEEGLPKPRSLGGWWSLGRRRSLSVQLSPRTPTPPKAVGPVQ